MAEGHGRSYKHWRYDQKSDPSRSTLWRRKSHKRKLDHFDFEAELSSTDRHDTHLNDVDGLRTNALLELKSKSTTSVSSENELSADNDRVSGILMIINFGLRVDSAIMIMIDQKFLINFFTSSLLATIRCNNTINVRLEDIKLDIFTIEIFYS